MKFNEDMFQSEIKAYKRSIYDLKCRLELCELDDTREDLIEELYDQIREYRNLTGEELEV